MVGVFDSGVGGLISLRRLRTICDRVDTVYLADYENAPYGTKKREELIPIISGNIKRLLALGCERVLVACCTASAMLKYLPGELSSLASGVVLPTLDSINRSGLSRIALIATDRTVEEGCFAPSGAEWELFPIKAQPLVGIVERGEWSSPYIDRLILKIKATSPEGLILGCTHFSHLEKRFLREIPEIRIFSPADIGAVAFSKEVNNFGFGTEKYV